MTNVVGCCMLGVLLSCCWCCVKRRYFLIEWWEMKLCWWELSWSLFKVFSGVHRRWRSSFDRLQMCAEFMAGMIRRSAVVYRAADLLSLCMSRNAEGIKGLMVCVIDLCFWIPHHGCNKITRHYAPPMDSTIGCIQGKHRIQIQNEVQLRCVECLYHPVMSIGSSQLCRLLWVLVLMHFELHKAIVKLRKFEQW